MRFPLAVSLLTLALACSTKASPPDAQGQKDAGAETSADTSMDLPVEQTVVYPNCTFTDSAGIGSQCDLAACLYRDAGSASPDADSVGCWPCPDGYACAILCPSPLGGCGPPAICCPVHQ